MATNTTNYSFTKPAVNDAADEDTWGTSLNGNWDSVDTEIKTASQARSYADNELQRPILKDYGEEIQTLSISTGASTWDIESGNHAQITLTENTTLTISNPTATGDFCGCILFVTQDGTGGRTLTFPASVQAAPTVTSTASKSDVYMLWTKDGGTKWWVQTMQTDISL